MTLLLEYECPQVAYPAFNAASKNNKAETVLQISRSKTDDTVSEVCAAMIRAAEFDPFAFRVIQALDLVVGIRVSTGGISGFQCRLEVAATFYRAVGEN